MFSRHKGNIAENKACEYLRSHGFKIIEQNFYAKKMGEIDIIATKNEIYHFIEVKSGQGFEPVFNITPSKLHKFLRSVQYYLKVKKLDVAYSIDAIIIKDDAIEFLENITL